MTVEVAEHKQEQMESQSQDGKTINQSDYGCQILLEKTTRRQVTVLKPRCLWVLDAVLHQM